MKKITYRHKDKKKIKLRDEKDPKLEESEDWERLISIQDAKMRFSDENVETA